TLAEFKNTPVLSDRSSYKILGSREPVWGPERQRTYAKSVQIQYVIDAPAEAGLAWVVSADLFPRRAVFAGEARAAVGRSLHRFPDDQLTDPVPRTVRRTPTIAPGFTDHKWSLREWLTFPAAQ